MDNSNDWIKNRVAYIKELKHPTKQQELLVLLATLDDRSTDDEKMLKALIRAEKAAIAADKAKTDVTKRLNAAAKEADKKRTHELIQSGLLLVATGLADSKTGKPKIDRTELAGALASMAKLPTHHEKRQLWQREGREILSKYDGKQRYTPTSSKIMGSNGNKVLTSDFEVENLAETT